MNGYTPGWSGAMFEAQYNKLCNAAPQHSVCGMSRYRPCHPATTYGRRRRMPENTIRGSGDSQVRQATPPNQRPDEESGRQSGSICACCWQMHGWFDVSPRCSSESRRSCLLLARSCQVTSTAMSAVDREDQPNTNSAPLPGLHGP